MADKRETVLLEDVTIFGGNYRNFTGRPTKFSPNGGKRTFTVAIPTEKMAQDMLAEGWNIKWTDPREDDDDPTPNLTIEVGWKYPPTIILVRGEKRTRITEDMCEIIDSLDIEKADVIINPGYWTDDEGKARIKAWLKSLYITIEEDYLARKYAINEADGL